MGMFGSPDTNMDGRYEPLLDCLWTISMPVNKLINVTFSPFELEGGGRREEKKGPWEPGGRTESGASHQKRACCLPVGESNPGLPRDRRGYSPLY